MDMNPVQAPTPLDGARRKAALGLAVGDTFETTRSFTPQEVAHFAGLSQDYNPVHFDARFASARGFPAPVCHGLLTASLVTEIGGQIGWLASGMDFRFRAPVYAGETVICTWIITAIDPRGRAKATAKIVKRDGTTVVEAQIAGLVPGAAERRVLEAMLSEGDPTNGLKAVCG
jgi:acyl dehydratase